MIAWLVWSEPRDRLSSGLISRRSGAGRHNYPAQAAAFAGNPASSLCAGRGLPSASCCSVVVAVCRLRMPVRCVLWNRTD